jgi:two-component system, NarL family, nitrate/nitrite response regulator NarL
MNVLTSHPSKFNDIAPERGRQHIDELIRKFVDQVASMIEAPSRSLPAQSHEEIVIDTIVDGVRYLLIRMSAPIPALVSLTPREQEIVRMVAKGYPNKTIAGILNISTWTVGTHLRRIFAKLGVASRAAMIARIMEEHPMWDHLPTAEVKRAERLIPPEGRPPRSVTLSPQDDTLLTPFAPDADVPSAGSRALSAARCRSF